MRKQALKLIIGMAKKSKKAKPENFGQLIDAKTYSGKNKTVLDMVTGKTKIVPISKREEIVSRMIKSNQFKRGVFGMDIAEGLKGKPTRVFSEIPFSQMVKLSKKINKSKLPKNQQNSLRYFDEIYVKKGKKK